MNHKHLLPAGLALLAIGVNSQAETVGFEEIPLAPESFFSGTPGSVTVIQSGPASFENNHVDWGGGFTSWTGWAVSNTTDNSTPGFANQYSAYSGSGQASSNYGVAYASPGANVTTTFDSVSAVSGGWFTNTTYPALSMLNGDGFARQFGGTSGDDEDWFMLTITGRDGAGVETGTVEVMLADYRFADNSQDYIVDEWLWVDLSGLGAVKTLDYALSSTDNGDFGMNTPGYFAMDNLEVAPVPLPAAVWLLASAIGGLGLYRRKG